MEDNIISDGLITVDSPSHTIDTEATISEDHIIIKSKAHSVNVKLISGKLIEIKHGDVKQFKIHKGKFISEVTASPDVNKEK